MIVGKVLIKNGFHNSNSDYFLLSCEVVFGKIQKHNTVVLDEESRWIIHSIDIPMKDVPSSIIISVRKEELDAIDIASLYKHEFFIED